VELLAAELLCLVVMCTIVKVQVHLKSRGNCVTTEKDPAQPSPASPADMLTVGQIAERCGVAASAVRYYDDEGLIVSTRTPGGQRRFSRDTIRRIAFILAAQRVGRPLADVRAVFEGLAKNRTPNQEDWSAASTAWRYQLNQQIEDLTALRDQLDSCIGCGCLSLERCAIYNPQDRASQLGAGARYLLGDSADDVL